MYVCNDCKEEFIAPYERNIDAGVHYDTGVIGKHKVPSMEFCPNCMSRNYKYTTKQEINDVKAKRRIRAVWEKVGLL
ncbi:MAG: hypothetical protein IJV71_12030 [Lachnospiraceae bacterium]|nr:hypothetical protein [Lachnospiraceae bacterium]